MSARQIQALHFPTAEHDNERAAIRARQRVLARLCRERLLTPLARRIGGVRAGSAGLVLSLGPVGPRVLGLALPRRRTHEPTLRFFDHTLATAQLVVDLHVAARQEQLDVLEMQAEPRCWRSFGGVGGRLVLRPDAFVSLGVDEYELRWFIEIDRATESLPTVLKKCHLYATYYQAGQEQAAPGGVFPRVCWVAPDDVRAERIRTAIEGNDSLPDRLFVVTTSASAVAALCGGTKQ